MKINLNIGGSSFAIGTGLMIVLASANLIRADGDDVLDAKQTATWSATSRSEGGDGINAKSNNLFGEDRAAKQDDNTERRRYTVGPSTESGQDFHNSQPDQPIPVWTIRSTPAKRAAALRLADMGNRLLQGGQYEKAVSIFEKALNVEANPYIYFYLARAHYQLGHYQDALNFLEASESWLMQQPDWAPELVALKGQIPGSGVSLTSSVVFAASK